MTIKDFVLKAQEGGWIPTRGGFRFKSFGPKTAEAYLLSQGDETILLDPGAWKAVGNVEGWTTASYKKHMRYRSGLVYANGKKEYISKVARVSNKWRKKWHGLIDALAEGKTIEQYLETL